MRSKAKKVRIIGVPMDLGQNQRGVDMGPSAVRYAGLARRLQQLGYETLDSGNITIPGHATLPGTSLAERLVPIAGGVRKAYELARKSIGRCEIPIFLGGDHSIAIGTIGGVTHQHDVGLLWIDAHGDFNTPETSPSQNVHGMALATLLGRGVQELVDIGRPGRKIHPDHVVLIGARNLDPQEREMLKESGCMIFTMREIDEVGINAVLRLALDRLDHLDHIHVSLDLDAMDPLEAPGVGTPSTGGLTYREGQLIMELIADTGKLHSVDIVEINPILDIQNRTAQVAVDLAASLFGQKIL
jgi:arginase